MELTLTLMVRLLYHAVPTVPTVLTFPACLLNDPLALFDRDDLFGWNIGDVIYAVPTHVCPTVALHRRACVVEGNRFIGTWEIASRDRKLTV